MMQAREHFKAAHEPAEASRIHSAGHGVGEQRSPPVTKSAAERAKHRRMSTIEQFMLEPATD